MAHLYEVVVLPDGQELPAGWEVFGLEWGDSLWAVSDDGWVIELRP